MSTFTSALAARQGLFDYRGTTFTCDPDNITAPVCTIVEEFAEQLPELTREGIIPLEHIQIVGKDLPDSLLPKPGWYYRDPVYRTPGPATVAILIDPLGVKHAGMPTITVSSRQLDMIGDFFREVMEGKLEPTSSHIE